MLGFRIAAHGGPEVLEFGPLPRPVMRPDEVLVAVRACGLNHLDLWVRNGMPGHRFPLPMVPGCEIAGDVVAVGEAVRHVAIGMRTLVAPGVSCGHCPRCLAGEDALCPDYGILGETRDGGYAELVAVPGRNILPLPPNLTYVEAAALPLVFMTAWHMLVTRAALRPHETVLVHAAGSGVSSAAIQIARLLHAGHIIATAGSDAKLARARALGADDTINYQTEDWVARARAILASRSSQGSRGVDVVVDHVGGEIFEKSLRLLAPGGRIVVCGATAGGTATVNLRALFFKAISILGSTMGSIAELATVLDFVARGELAPVVDRVYPWRQAPAAQAALARREQFGKLVLEMPPADASSDSTSPPEP
jgi:NADPH:quinone reductase-like Zn-dependent oxidoreductase